MFEGKLKAFSASTAAREQSFTPKYEQTQPVKIASNWRTN